MKRWMLLIGMGFMTSILQAMSLSNALQNVTSHVQTLQQVVRAKPQSIYHNPIVPQTSSSSFFTKDPRTSSQKDNVVFYGRLNLQTLSKALGNYGLRPNADILKDIPFFDYGIYANITSGGLDTIERVLKEKFGSGESYLTFFFKVDDHKQLTNLSCDL